MPYVITSPCVDCGASSRRWVVDKRLAGAGTPLQPRRGGCIGRGGRSSLRTEDSDFDPRPCSRRTVRLSRGGMRLAPTRILPR